MAHEGVNGPFLRSVGRGFGMLCSQIVNAVISVGKKEIKLRSFYIMGRENYLLARAEGCHGLYHQHRARFFVSESEKCCKNIRDFEADDGRIGGRGNG